MCKAGTKAFCRRLKIELNFWQCKSHFLEFKGRMQQKGKIQAYIWLGNVCGSPDVPCMLLPPAPVWGTARGLTGKLRGWLWTSWAGNLPLHSRSSVWISETAVVGISVPAHSGRAAGHRAGMPAKRKQHQVRERTQIFCQRPITVNKTTRTQAAKLTTSTWNKIQSQSVYTFSRTK